MALIEEDVFRETTADDDDARARLELLAQEDDRVEHRLATREGGEIPYERLLLATGARARRLALEGGEHAILLRTYDDALQLKDRNAV
jgi:NADH dehydrogenase FAD-containing subunit